MNAVLLKSEVVLFYWFLATLTVLSSLHMFTGYADNGDFYRSVSFLFEKADAFPEPWFLLQVEETHEYALKGWYDKWKFIDYWPSVYVYTYSSYKLYLLLQAKIASFLSQNTQYYSIMLASIFSRIIMLATFFAILFNIRKNTSVFVFWIFTIIFSAVFLSSAWQGFLNSFYEDQVAIIFLPIVALLLYKIYSEKNKKIINDFVLVSIFITAAFVGSSKVAFFYLPSLLACFLWTAVRSKLVVKNFILFYFLSQSLCIFPFLFQNYSKINAYHSVYIGALTLDSKEVVSLKNIGSKPIVQECIGVPFYMKNGEACIEQADVSYKDLLLLIVKHPKIAVQMIRNVFEYANNIEIFYISKNMAGIFSFSALPAFNIFSKLFAYYFNVIILLLSLFALFIVTVFNNKKFIPMLKTGLFFSAFGFSQYGVALADGFNEISKHLMVANYALAIGFAFMFSGLLQFIYEYFKATYDSAWFYKRLRSLLKVLQ